MIEVTDELVWVFERKFRETLGCPLTGRPAAIKAGLAAVLAMCEREPTSLDVHGLARELALSIYRVSDVDRLFSKDGHNLKVDADDFVLMARYILLRRPAAPSAPEPLPDTIPPLVETLRKIWDNVNPSFSTGKRWEAIANYILYTASADKGTIEWLERDIERGRQNAIGDNKKCVELATEISELKAEIERLNGIAAEHNAMRAELEALRKSAMTPEERAIIDAELAKHQARVSVGVDDDYVKRNWSKEGIASWFACKALIASRAPKPDPLQVAERDARLAWKNVCTDWGGSDDQKNQYYKTARDFMSAWQALERAGLAPIAEEG